MEYNLVKGKMKKICLFLVGLFILTNIALPNTINDKKVSKKYDLSLIINPINTETGTSTVEILVKANQYVDDLCNYFNGSWVDTGLKIYCKLGGDVYTCTAYKVVNISCSVNGAVRLAIEGDYESALKRLLTATPDVYNLYKEYGNYYLEK